MYRLALLVSVLSVLLCSSPGYAFEFKGFVDVTFSGCDGDACDEESGENGDFAFGTLDLYASEEFEDIDVLVEFIIEKGDVLDLERLSIGYTFSDALKVKMGRFHTPLGFWNTAFHHGVQLQTTIGRPGIVEFEDDAGIIPSHTVGINLSGRTNISQVGIDYSLMIGNGEVITNNEGANALFPNNISDDNSNKAVLLNLGISPRVLKGLRFGVSGYSAKVESDEEFNLVNNDTVDVSQIIYAPYLNFVTGNLELTSEYIHFSNKDELGDSGTNKTAGYYGLISYTFKEQWTPYMLYENVEVEESDPYMTALAAQDSERQILGLKYNLNYRTSLKAEIRRVEIGDEDRNEYGFQWAAAF